MPIVSSIKKIFSEFGEKSSSVAKCLRGGRLRICLSMIYCLARYGARPIDYERFRFYEKSSHCRNRYLTFFRYMRLYKRLLKDAEGYPNISADKVQEYKTFNDFIHRPWMSFSKLNGDLNSLKEFINQNGRVIAKPSHGEQGHGVAVITRESNLNDFLGDIGNVEYIIERVVENCTELKQLNPTSLNTLRIVTLIDKDSNVNVLGAWLRVGSSGNVVDNWGAGGVGYNVDIRTGIIDRLGQDKKNRPHLFHPGTDICMVGFQIPKFTIAVEEAKKMALTTPYARYVGWDIAITENGVDLIEMNLPPGHDMMQSFENPIYDTIKELI